MLRSTFTRRQQRITMRALQSWLLNMLFLCSSLHLLDWRKTVIQVRIAKPNRNQVRKKRLAISNQSQRHFAD